MARAETLREERPGSQNGNNAEAPDRSDTVKTCKLKNATITAETFIPGSPNMSLPKLDECQAKFYMENERLAATVAKKVLAKRGIHLPDVHLEDIVTQSQNGMMRGIAAYKPQSTTAAAKQDEARRQYGALCAKRSVEKRLRQYHRCQQTGMRRIAATVRDTDGSEEDTFTAIAEYNDRAAELAEEALSLLTPDEQRIVKMKFGIGQLKSTTEEVAEQLGLSAETVKRRHANALARLRAAAIAGDIG